jgi:serine/threonine protein kinase
MKNSNQLKLKKKLKELKKKLKLETKKKKINKKSKFKKEEEKFRRTPNKRVRAKSKITTSKKNTFGSQRRLDIKRIEYKGLRKNIDKKSSLFPPGSISCREITKSRKLTKLVDSNKNKSRKKKNKKFTNKLPKVIEDKNEESKVNKGKYVTNPKQRIFKKIFDDSMQIKKYGTLKMFKKPLISAFNKKKIIFKKNKKKVKKKKKKSKIVNRNVIQHCSKSTRIIRAEGEMKRSMVNHQRSIILEKIESTSSKEIAYDDEFEKQLLRNSKEKEFQKILQKKVETSVGLTQLKQNIKDIFHDTSPNSWILIFQTSLDFYLIEKEIGNGSFGQVFKAIQILTNTQVALKKICKNTIRLKGVEEKIQREIKILKNLNDHPNVVRLIEEFEDSEYYYLVFEYLPEGDLVTYFRRNNLFCENELKRFFYKILEGLNHIHLKGVIHRDIKPENILLDSTLSPKIADFGISTIFRKKQSIRDTGGTPIYLAPEVIRAEGDVCFNTDVWSCGILLYLLAVGDVPFKADEVQILYGKILNDPFDITKKIENEDVTSELGDLIAHMLIKDPRHRYSLKKCMKHPWFWPHNKNFGKSNRRKSQMDRSKSQNCSINNSNLLSKNSFYLLKSDIQGNLVLGRNMKKANNMPTFNNINSCKKIPFLNNGLKMPSQGGGRLRSFKNLDRETIQKKSKTFKQKVQNFDKILNSSTEIMNTNSRNFKSQRKIKRTKLNDQEINEIKVSAVLTFLKESGFPQKYITDTVFEKDKQFTHIKSCFDQFIESL